MNQTRLHLTLIALYTITTHAVVGDWVSVDDMNLERFYQHPAPKTYLLSFPGSGNTWLRYCLEYLTKRPTLEMRNKNITKINCPIGYWCDMGTDYSAAPIWKVHYLDQMKNMGTVAPEQETLIVIVRNPKEALPRIMNVLWLRQHGQPWPERTAANLINNSMTMRYIEILKLYDRWHPDKRYMMYYEDLITNPERTLTDLLIFLGKDSAIVQQFISDYQQHKEQSLHLYETQEDRSLTHGNSTHHHATLLSAQERSRCDMYMQQLIPELWHTYLADRYAES